MKRNHTLLALFFFCFFALGSLKAQLVDLSPGKGADPLQGTKDLYQNAEMLFLWDNALPNDDIEVHLQIADYLDASALPLNQKFTYSTTQTENGANTNTGSRFMTMAKGDFNADGFDDIIAAWTYQNKVLLCLPAIDNQTLSWSNAQKITVGGNISATSGSYKGRIRLATGNFDADDADEFVVAYRDNVDSKVHIEIYDGTTLTQTPLASVSDATVPEIGGYESFDIAVRDFDLDGTDEIVLVYRSANSLYVRLYTLNGTDLVAKTQTEVNSQLDGGYGYAVGVCTGDFDRNIIDEIAVGWGRVDGNSGATEDTYIQVVEVKDNSASQNSVLDTLVFNASSKKKFRYSSGDQTPVRLKSGDVNGDGQDEILLSRDNGVEVYEADTNFVLTQKTSVSSYQDDFQYSDDFFDVADVDKDGAADIIMMKSNYDVDNEQQYFVLTVHTFDNNFTPTLAAQNTNYQFQDLTTVSGNTSIVRRHYAMVAGDFDGDRVRVGVGTHYVKTEIVQPLVILNAPPIHFDILDSVAYDVNKCYNSNTCQHKSTYVYQNDQQVRVQSNVGSDWGVSSTLGAGGTFGAIGVSAKVTAKYGEKFSNEKGSTQKVTVITQVSAREDDLIYATVCDYDAWEYPVYENDSIRGYILALVPKLTENRWFPSKSWSAYTYVPDHEVGNALSYRPYTQFTDNPLFEEKVRADYISDSYVLDANQNYDWTLQFSDFTTASASTTKEIGLEVGAEVSGWGISLSATGTYNSSEMSTHSTEVGDQVTVKVELRTVDKSLGETGYTVTPYAYWSKNGALTLDYAVRPEEPVPGGTPTWWTENYKQKQDPAFILPWRYDPEKGFGLQDPAKRRQTKSITFFPENPQVGDTVKIKARIHNFSMLPTDTAVKVSFYFDDPVNGNIITGLTGETFVYTNGPIGARENQVVQMQFVMPSGLGSSPRIYATIDPDNAMDEIHKDNNIGFNILGQQGFQPVGIEEPAAEPVANGISKVYPNPALDIASIQFDLEKPSFVSLRVYDLQGREVKKLLEGNESAGKIDVSFDTKEMHPGIYLYRLQVGNYSETQRIVLVR